MTKIRLEYLVPNGEFCAHMCEGVNVSGPCTFLHNYKWCMLFGGGPVVTEQGHTVIYNKLHRCIRATIKEEPANITPPAPQIS